ncbi:MAG: 3'(2'),5'-bisphosphate nucleotidase CysQ [Terriglobales bacterium]|jgi:myo-inositol-1(or 4)-monophosphatase
MTSSTNSEILQRIHSALESARSVLRHFTAGAIETEYKVGHDPVTEADRSVDAVLRKELLRQGEGWLSEESVDDFSRLDQSHVWVVDPLDGTREFVQGIPEFCVSIAMVENGKPIAGGICNPATNELIMGSRETGVTYNGQPAHPTNRSTLDGALILASRSELKRGEWTQFQNSTSIVKATGSVAYKLGLVAAGRADITFTLTPKNEWDVAAGALLVEAAGGFVSTLDGQPLTCNHRNPLLTGLIACGPNLREPLLTMLREHLPVGAARS